ncbi:hypothetical protein MKX03_028207 [Papaver bracteatum]|nr:hypothetical protein MKX03_028207 [Papaver bracteatum]
MKVLETSKATIHDATLEGFRKRMISNYRNFRSSNTHCEICSSGNSELYQEEMRRFNQANLARRVKRITRWRLLGSRNSGTKAGSDKQDDAERTVTSVDLQLEEDKNPKYVELPRKILVNYVGPAEGTHTPELQLENESFKTIKLTNVTIFPWVGGQGKKTVIGTLEAHVNGFRYTTSGEQFQVDIIYDNVKKAFFRVDDERMPPLLHFHLYHHIMVGAEKTKDFQLAMNLVGCKRSASGNNKAFQDFVHEVNGKWRSQPISHLQFELLYKKNAFCGVRPSMAPAVFYLTVFSLVGIVEAPFVVVKLRDVEIVNLAQLRPGEIDMTVVFQDFKRPVLQINSIPIESLEDIKWCLDAANIKFYVNERKVDWALVLEGIRDFPETFIKNGAWDFFNLEDSDTSGYYSDDSHLEHDDTDVVDA